MSLHVFLLVSAVFNVVAQTVGQCSFDDTSLELWSSGSTWGGSAKKPKEGEKAVIAAGKHVLLDESPPNLTGITIEAGASLVWGDFDGLTVTTDYILIKGKFIIGDESSDCRFTKRAHIRLTGTSNTSNVVEHFGMKFIGVDNGGIIEVHGAEKLSWTQLIQTVPAGIDTCGVVFDFMKSSFSSEMSSGLFVAVFDLDGSVFDFGVFKTGIASMTNAEADFQTFMNGIPDGKILMVAVNSALGTGSVTSRDWNKVYEAVEAAGGLTSTVLRNVNGRDAYAFITKTGDHASTIEQHAAMPAGENIVSTESLSLTEASTDMVFSVVGNIRGTGKALEMRAFKRAVGQPKIKLNADARSWKTGDTILVTSTDFDWKQVEEFKLVDCSSCAENEVRLDHPFKYMHYGEITHNVDERAEVALLSRPILIEGVMEDSCYVNDDKDQTLCDLFDQDTHGGHIKVRHQMTAAHIEGAELYHMGQQKFLGTYPLHFHMCDDVMGSWFRNNSIHHSQTRCVTIHGTDRSETSDNVCYLTFGHSYFLEDSVEQWNILDRNLAVGTQHGTLIMSDKHSSWCTDEMSPFCNALSSFWLTHPNNYIRNNVAAGSDNTGFWYSASKKPLGPSREHQKVRKTVPDMQAINSKILEFDNNAAHSCKGKALRMDDRISHGEYNNDIFVPENGMIAATSSHLPLKPNGELATSVMTRFRAYKNFQNVWTKAGNLIMENFTLADCSLGISMSRSDINLQTFTTIRNSIFIGETDNTGLPEEPWGRSNRGNSQEIVQGVNFYQGPSFVTNCFFDKYVHKHADNLFRPAGALSFRRSSTYPAAPSNAVTGIKFGFCDEIDHPWVFQGNTSLLGSGFGNLDGNRAATFRDYDGSVTGTANTQIVQNHRFFTTDRCSYRSDWNVWVCPYDYCRVIFSGKGGAMTTNRKNYALYVVRDDRTSDALHLEGTRKDNYLVIKGMSYTVYFNGSAPSELDVESQNLLLGESVRIGICYPKDTTDFTFSSQFPKIGKKDPATKLNSLAELDSDSSGTAYYWDSATGMLNIKVVGTSARLNNEICPGMECMHIKIKRIGGHDQTPTCFDDAYGGDGKYRKTEDSTTPIPEKPTACITQTAEGLGVPIANANYLTEAFDPTCPAPKTPIAIQSLGCYKDVNNSDLPFERISLASMTVEFCVQRCYNRDYVYAAVQSGSRCLCGDYYGAYGETPTECGLTCSNGDTCGGANRNSVFATGRPVKAGLETCGASNKGAVIDNKCYYLTDDPVSYSDAQRTCVRMGGNLATITSAEVQRDVEIYMRPKMVDAWFGLNDIEKEGTRVYVDGTSTGGYYNIIQNQGSTNNKDGFAIEAANLYAWRDRVMSNALRALCQLPLNAVAPVGATCGETGEGKSFGSGGCYLVINEKMKHAQAEYACYMKMGNLVTMTDANKDELLMHLFIYGDSRNYWTNQKASANKYYEILYDTMYLTTRKSNVKRTNGAICLLDTRSAAIPCSTGWQHNAGFCYLYTKLTLKNYAQAVDICTHGSSKLVTIHSEAENTFVSTIVGATNVFIGYKYNPTSQAFEWIDGQTSTYENWKSGQGLSRISRGECVRMNGPWSNANCAKPGVVMCKTPAFS